MAAVSPKPVIISASRRTDMVVGNPEGLVERLAETAPPANTHSVVIWTKSPHNLLHHQKLHNCLLKYDQRFLLYSITGLGGSPLEPGVPKPEQAIAMLPDLIKMFGTAEHIRVRFDPIVHMKMPDGQAICNLTFFEKLAPELQDLGITHVITSWVQLYPKVIKRLARAGITTQEPSMEQWQQEAGYLQSIAEKHKLTIHGCCVPGWPTSRCIDGYLLNSLHPKGLKATTQKAPGQRGMCGCTKSRDIGWYSGCPNGCIYCYGNPQIEK